MTREGLRNYFWPLDRKEVIAVRDHFLKGGTAYLRAQMGHERAAEVFALNLFAAFLVEVLSVYRAKAAVRRLSSHGRMIDAAPRSRLISAFQRGQTPESSRSIDLLRGLNPQPWWHRSLRVLKDRIPRDGIATRAMSAIDPHSTIVTIASGEMIRQHASGIEEPVRFVRFIEWFGKLNQQDRPGFGGPAPVGLVEALLELSEAAFTAGNEKMDRPAAQYLRDWIEAAVTLADCHLTRLMAQPRLVPRRLWRGTGGHLYGRILSHACCELGGEVTGHDHAQGQGFSASAKDTIVEYPGCDRFMVWTETQRQMSLRNLRLDLLLQEKVPDICVVPGQFRPKLPTSLARTGLKTVRTIMYVGMLYSGETVHVTPLIPDVVLIDWEARLIGKLIDWGYEVLIKPHPELQMPMPRDYFEALGARILDDYFEDVYDQADLIILSQVNSTAFFGIIGTDYPVVIADTGMHKWQAEALEMLSGRCAMVVCKSGPDNRLQMDWDQLKLAIETAPKLNDRSFYQSFFSGRPN